VPKTSIDDLLETIKLVKDLRESVADHKMAIDDILERLNQLEQRVAAVLGRQEK
jgi:hypothetical protein